MGFVGGGVGGEGDAGAAYFPEFVEDLEDVVVPGVFVGVQDYHISKTGVALQYCGDFAELDEYGGLFYIKEDASGAVHSDYPHVSDLGGASAGLGEGYVDDGLAGELEGGEDEEGEDAENNVN